MKTLYYHATFYTMADGDASPAAEDAAAPAKASALVTEDGQILAVGSDGELRTDHPEAEEYDLGGGFVFPGFIDLYSAPGLDAFSAYCRSEGAGDAEIQAWATDAWDYLLDKGVSRLLIHCRDASENILAGAAESLGVPVSSFIYDLSCKTAFEEDLYPGYYDAIAGSPLETRLLFDPVYSDGEGVHDILRNLTINAAEKLGLSHRLGSLEPGKAADLTVFEKNPYEITPDNLPWMHAMLVVHQGQVVYDAAASAMSELYDLLTQQPF